MLQSTPIILALQMFRNMYMKMKTVTQKRNHSHKFESYHRSIYICQIKSNVSISFHHIAGFSSENSTMLIAAGPQTVICSCSPFYVIAKTIYLGFSTVVKTWLAIWRGQPLFYTLFSANIELKRSWRVCFHLCLFGVWLGWFVSRITQKLLNRFARNLDGGWVSTQKRHPITFGADLGKIQDFFYLFFLTFFNRVSQGFSQFLQFIREESGVCRWLESMSEQKGCIYKL